VVISWGALHGFDSVSEVPPNASAAIGLNLDRRKVRQSTHYPHHLMSRLTTVERPVAVRT